MPKTDAEKREYTRGYNRGRNRAIAWAQKAIVIAKAYRDRLADSNTERRCSTCLRWTRGCKDCLWGRCSGDFERRVEPAMWAETPYGTPRRDDLELVTTEDFGCACWLPRGTRAR